MHTPLTSRKYARAYQKMEILSYSMHEKFAPWNIYKKSVVVWSTVFVMVGTLLLFIHKGLETDESRISSHLPHHIEYNDECSIDLICLQAMHDPSRLRMTAQKTLLGLEKRMLTADTGQTLRISMQMTKSLSIAGSVHPKVGYECWIFPLLHFQRIVLLRAMLQEKRIASLWQVSSWYPTQLSPNIAQIRCLNDYISWSDSERS